MRRKTPERDLQVLYFKWLRNHPNKLCSLIHSSGNGNYKNIVTAKKAKEEGMLSGVWDVLFPFPSSEWNGMWIEFKSPTGRLTREQKWFKSSLEEYYKFEVVRDLETAIKITEDYLEDV